jgi:hypothetical protein
MRKKHYVPDYDVTFFAHGSTPRSRKPAGVAVVGRMRATRDLLEVARPVDVENKSHADLIALRLAVEILKRTGFATILRYVYALETDIEGTAGMYRTRCDRLVETGEIERDYFLDARGDHWTIYALPGLLKLPAYATERVGSPAEYESLMRAKGVYPPVRP